MSKGARNDLKFSNVDEMIADADRLRSGPYTKAGKWDLPTILDHLARSIGNAFVPDQKNLPWPVPAIVRFGIHLFVRREFYPAMKFPMPKPFRPDPGKDLDAAYSDFISAANKLKDATGETIDVPPIGTLPLDDFRKLQLMHAAHHLGFLKSDA